MYSPFYTFVNNNQTMYIKRLNIKNACFLRIVHDQQQRWRHKRGDDEETTEFAGTSFSTHQWH